MGTNENIVHLSGHQGALYDAWWDADSGTWLTAGGDGIVAEWHGDGKDEGQAVLHHDRAFFCVGSRGKFRVGGTENGELFVWERTKPSATRRFQAHTNGLFAVAWLNDEEMLTGGGDERLVWRQGADELRAWQIPGARKIRCIVPSPGGCLVGTSAGFGLLLPAFSEGHEIDLAQAVRIDGHAGGCYAALWHQEKKVWLTGGRDGHIRVWDGRGTPVLAFPAHEGAIYRMVASEGAIWTCGRDKAVKAWDLDQLEPLRRLTHREGGSLRSVNALAVRSGERESILFGGDDRIGRLLAL